MNEQEYENILKCKQGKIIEGNNREKNDKKANSFYFHGTKLLKYLQ